MSTISSVIRRFFKILHPLLSFGYIVRKTRKDCILETTPDNKKEDSKSV
jgi:hypothetical protein